MINYTSHRDFAFPFISAMISISTMKGCGRLPSGSVFRVHRPPSNGLKHIAAVVVWFLLSTQPSISFHHSPLAIRSRSELGISASGRISPKTFPGSNAFHAQEELVVTKSTELSAFPFFRDSSRSRQVHTNKAGTKTKIFNRVRALYNVQDDDNTDAQHDESGDPIFNGQSTVGLVGAQSVLILASVVAAVVLGVPNYGLGAGFRFEAPGFILGTVAVAPLAVFAVVLDFVENSVPALKDVTLATQRSVLSLLGMKRKPLTAAVVALALGLAAGIGEEMLFRGVLQSTLTDRLLGATAFAQPISIGITSVFFGLLHAVTPLYAILATLASVYFGWVYVALGDGNLLVPMVCHAVYDVGALLWAHYVVTAMSQMEQNEILNWMPPSGNDSSTIL
jgi:membrane protease YdiL (CAAX protease family)